jgi:hypothetical protein
LGLDAQALLEEDEPRFVWKVATFKHLSASSANEREALVSYGTSLTRTLLAAVPEQAFPTSLEALRVREQLLAAAKFVTLPDILSLCWAIGIPVVHLKVLPLPAKRMCAMATRVRDRYAILLARESKFPAQLAYYVAHELGHIALGHLSTNPAVVDADDPLRADDKSDPEEVAADRYALELLTGEPEPRVITEAKQFVAAALAKAAVESSEELQIEPGTLALCFGHSTGRWDKTVAALKRIYPQNQDVAPYINKVAVGQLMRQRLPDDADEYLRAALGLSA